jgi:hypothetical protein
MRSAESSLAAVNCPLQQHKPNGRTPNIPPKYSLLNWSRIVWIAGFFLFSIFPAGEVKAYKRKSGSDWIYIDQGCISSCLGVFHDKTSGAFIGLEISITGLPGEFAPLVAKKAGLPVVTVTDDDKTYHTVSVEENRRRYIKDTCPPGEIVAPEAMVFSYSDKAEAKTWNFTAIACNPNQRQRIGSLITRTEWRDVISAVGSENDSMQPEDLSIGANWDEVGNKLGKSVVPMAYQGGFVISYRIDRGPKDFSLTWLFFNQERVLKKITTADPKISVYPGPNF